MKVISDTVIMGFILKEILQTQTFTTDNNKMTRETYATTLTQILLQIQATATLLLLMKEDEFVWITQYEYSNSPLKDCSLNLKYS